MRIVATTRCNVKVQYSLFLQVKSHLFARRDLTDLASGTRYFACELRLSLQKIAVWFTNGSCYGFAASSLSSNRHEIGDGSKAPKNKTFPQIRIILRLNKALHCVL